MPNAVSANPTDSVKDRDSLKNSTPPATEATNEEPALKDAVSRILLYFRLY